MNKKLIIGFLVAVFVVYIASVDSTKNSLGSLTGQATSGSGSEVTECVQGWRCIGYNQRAYQYTDCGWWPGHSPLEKAQKWNYCGSGQICQNTVNSVTCVDEASVNRCEDSDGGKNFYKKGNTTSSRASKKEIGSDFCVGSTTLREFYCDDPLSRYGFKIIYSADFECAARGCVDGACKRSVICDPNGECSVILYTGESATVDGRTIKLISVDSAGAIIIDVEGVTKTISSNQKEIVNGVVMINKLTLYDPNNLNNNYAELSIYKRSTPSGGDGGGEGSSLTRQQKREVLQLLNSCDVSDPEEVIRTQSRSSFTTCDKACALKNKECVGGNFFIVDLSDVTKNFPTITMDCRDSIDYIQSVLEDIDQDQSRLNESQLRLSASAFVQCACCSS